jgi:excisionase family DNA binding protein
MTQHKKLFYKIAEAAEVLGVHKVTLYRALARGELNTVMIGARNFVPAGELARLAQVPLEALYGTYVEEPAEPAEPRQAVGA